MDETNSLIKIKISIVGLGLMGGSLAIGLNRWRESLTGFDADPATRKLAAHRNIVERVASDLQDAVAQADVIILATPVGAILEILAELPAFYPGKAIVLDLGSSKSEILQAMDNLPPRFDPIGGHPICGKEQLSLENADGELFRNAVFSFTALPRTSEKARAFATQLAHTLGANPLWLDPEAHDKALALTSHTPYLIAAALALAAPEGAAPLAGPGFRSAARLAATPAAMMIDVLRTNKENISQSIAAFQDQINELAGYLNSDDFASLEETLNASAAHLADFYRTGEL